MELTSIPEKSSSNKVFVCDDTAPEFTIKENKIEQNGGFYYIGKNERIVEHLTKTFTTGSTFDSLASAKSALMHCFSHDDFNIPAVIFFDSAQEIIPIKGFRQFLANNLLSSPIPFILNGSGLSEQKLNYYRKNKLSDDIVWLDDFDEKNITAKVLFLKKVKSRSNQLKDNSRTNYSTVVQDILKRIFDIIMSAIIMILLTPVFLLIALAVKAESGDPVFYISKRAGKGYKIFNFYKFRTMFTGADEKIGDLAHLNLYNTDLEKKGPVFIKINNDPRVTRVGSFLRKTSLDELPQLVNVLRGDMSFVGNRPLPLYEAETMTTNEWASRFMAPAGITGLWQIKKRGREDMSAEERIELDIAYASNSNFAYDLWIMAKTPSALFQKINS